MRSLHLLLRLTFLLPARAAVLVGRVVDADGQPVPGLVVSGQGRRAQQPVALTPVTTDDQGTFGLEYVREGEWGAYLRVVTQPDERGVAWFSGQAEGKVRLTLQPAREVTGRVADADGRPVAGVRLAFYYLHNPPGQPNRDFHLEADLDLPGWHTTTDAEGNWRLWLPDGVQVALLATHPDYANDGLELPASGTTAKSLTLFPPARLAGRLLGVDGQPAGGVDLWLDGPTPGRDQVTTGPDGRFEWRGLQPGRYRVELPSWQWFPAVLPASEVLLERGEDRGDLAATAAAEDFGALI